jgi:glycine cleavage system aminomethyltransferase T
VPSIVLRFDLGNVLGYQVYFERAYSEYVWDVVFGAGSELGIVPVGFSAMKLLGWSME